MSQPEEFEHYKLLKKEDGSLLELGHGAMGTTYRAFDRNLHCEVALKVISNTYLNDPTAAERFLREARGAAQLRHRNVASIFHLGRHRESYFYAMEFIDGETVDKIVKRDGAMSCPLALDLASQVACALIAAHSQGLVHRDIKPSNLMVTREHDGEMLVKVIDFGLVKSAVMSSSAGALTSTGFVGTPYFASPEQLDQRNEDIRSDIYSLGITLWFMLTSKPTFMGSVASVISQHLDKDPAFESLAVLPACVVGVLRKMLQKDVTKRFQTPAELRAELKHCIEILRTSPTPSAVPAGHEEDYQTVALSSTHGLQERPRVGSLLGERYKLIEDLNPANPHRVFHAEDVTQKRRVRVKVVRSDIPAFARIEEEVARLRTASQPHFVEVIDVSRFGELGVVALEWLEGFSLLELLRARREITPREAHLLLEQIAPAVDAAHALDIKLELTLSDVLVHFPEGFDEPSAQVILRCPLVEWPAFTVKLNPLGHLQDLESSSTWGGERTHVIGCAPGLDVLQLGTLVYDLLGGKPGGFAPLASLPEQGNEVLRRCRTTGETYCTAKDFLDAWSGIASSAPIKMAPLPPPAPPANPLPPKQKEATLVPPPKLPFPPDPRRRTPASSGTAGAPKIAGLSSLPRLLRNPWIASGAAGAVLLLAVLVFWLFRGSPENPQFRFSVPGNPPKAKAPAKIPFPPLQPGKPWKNSLEMNFVPVGELHFATIETRVRDFEVFVEAAKYDAVGGMYSLQAGGLKQYGHSWKTPGFPQTPNHPVVGVSWDDANIFCDWLTQRERADGTLTATQFYRLPTDREWSQAAGLVNEPGASPEERSGKIKGVYPWGRTLPPTATGGNYAGSEVRPTLTAGAPAKGEPLPTVPDKFPVIPGYRDAFARTCATPGFPSNALGISDLGGNVWEWCQNPYKKGANWRVLRGGSWATSRPEELLTSFRRAFDPSFRHDDIGFRCVIATDWGTP